MATKVLHVVESLSSGVATAIEAYVENRPEGTEHVVYGYRRPGVQVGDGLSEHARVVELPEGRAGQLSTVRQGLRSERPDVVHVHSSWAGLAVSSMPKPKGVRWVYTPHGFAFERLDLPERARRAVLAVERGLLRRTDAVAAVGRYEATLARQLGGDVEVVEVPHTLPARARAELGATGSLPGSDGSDGSDGGVRVCAPVSYTHLTLPTKRIV